ncbi:MAG: glycoside hydrolase family 9 protein [Butyrivibrio sp.]|nr:glycoside hydrolase family 9 protein [Butyrivibrio sp.]
MRGGRKIISGITAAAVITMLFTGCSSKEEVKSDNAAAENSGNEQSITEQDQVDVTDPALDMSYELPVDIPGILIDQKGYEIESEKIAVFRGEEIADTFEVRDLETDKVVYTGEIRRLKYNEELNEYDSYGYFTELETPGDYYIYNETLGSSYSFSISDDIYMNLMKESAKVFYYNRCGYTLMEQYAGESAHSACHTNNAYLEDDKSVQMDVTGGWHLDAKANRDIIEGCDVAQNLLLSYELNKDAFSDDSNIPESGDTVPDILNEIKYEVDWMLKMQDSKTGGVHAAALTVQNGVTELSRADVQVTPITMDATIAFAGLLAKFSYLYQSFDSSYATDCLRAADRAWKCYMNNENEGENSLCFLAAAELYRATGNASYKEVMDIYFADEDFSELFKEDDAVFLGGVTYISTTQPVDREQCTTIMNALRKRSEEIASNANNSTLFVTKCTGGDVLETLFDDMRCLTVTDYIIYNHEYTTIIENHAHFLMGLNPEAINYVTNDTENSYEMYDSVNSILSNPVYISKFIIMLSVLQ